MTSHNFWKFPQQSHERMELKIQITSQCSYKKWFGFEDTQESVDCAFKNHIFRPYSENEHSHYSLKA